MIRKWVLSAVFAIGGFAADALDSKPVDTTSIATSAERKASADPARQENQWYEERRNRERSCGCTRRHG